MADALVRELNGKGFLPVFLPRSGVVPPELYSWSRQRKRLVRLGPLAAVLPATAGIAPTSGRLADFDFRYTSSKKLEAAVSFLENALKCIGIDSAPKVKLDFTRSQDFSFAFTGVTVQSVDLVHLYPVIDQLSTAGLPQEDLDGGLLHIAYEYAYARELHMSRGDKTSFSAEVAGKLGDYFDLHGKGSVAMSATGTIAFKGQGDEATAFAYKAARLVREDGRWTLHAEAEDRLNLVAGAATADFLPVRGEVLVVE